MSGALSAIASDLWPGTGKDKTRFVEAWVRCAPDRSSTRISIPALIRLLRKNGEPSTAARVQALRGELHSFGNSDRVVTGGDIDAEEEEVSSLGIARALIRRASYPSVFYEQVRSSLVHEYSLSEASQYPMSGERVLVSYVNTLGAAETMQFENEAGEKETYVDRPIERNVHFHMDRMIDLVRDIARNAEALRGKVEVPACWWLTGD